MKELYYHFQQNRVQLEAYNTRKLKRYIGWNDLQHCYALQEIKLVRNKKKLILCFYVIEFVTSNVIKNKKQLNSTIEIFLKS